MKRSSMLLMLLLAMTIGSHRAFAQSVTITLMPGWNWISYPNAVSMDIEDALGDFEPVGGDRLKSVNLSTEYDSEWGWYGDLETLEPGQGYMYYSARTEAISFVFAQAPSSIVTTAEPTDITTTSAVVGGIVTLDEGNHIYARGVCWGTEVKPTINGDHISNGAETGNFTDTLIGLTQNTTYYVRAYVVTDYGLAYGEELSFATENDGGDHEYVDLGLPSGLLWATCNVGADAPEDYGDYFAWGETEPKNYYNWNTYQYCNGGHVWGWSTLTKYCSNSSYGYNGFTDNLTTLLPEDDAATANWGSGWRMPTQAEWQELLDNTICTWTTQNGVNGRLFTAANGNSLFLPAAGSRCDGGLTSAGSSSVYWSSSLSTDDPYHAWMLYFNSGYCSMYGGDRDYGQSVRPVRSAVPQGAINGKFTINDNGDQVYFSQGNLQYQASTNTWKFADNQYDYVGSDNSNISSTYSGWIDLFGWGTSGYNHGANCYQPWSTLASNSDYYAYGSATYNLYDQTGKADWGYNPISNGGNTTNYWRTLATLEWRYIFNTRTTDSGIRYAKAQVNDVNGVILLPDDWNSNVYSLSNTNSSSASFSSNIITATQWTSLENAGAVFIPAAGYRSETSTSIHSVGSYGRYWSASYSITSDACSVYFNDSNLNPGGSDPRRSGRSVRLVHNAE